MTLKLSKFGKILVTRQDARKVLHVVVNKGSMPVLDFTGVDVANHCFADELGKGLMACFGSGNLQLIGANAYVQNCVEAGLATAGAA